MTQNEQIDELNSVIKTTIGVSRINGVGVIALRDIAKGERIWADRLPKVYRIPYGSLSKLFPEIREEILKRWSSVINDSMFPAPCALLIAYMNHSDYPNYSIKSDTALIDIKKGEEITEDYKLMDNWEKVFKWLK